MSPRRLTRGILLTSVCLGGCAGGADPNTVTEVLVEGLNNPTAVIVEAGGSWVVAESGAGRILRVGADGAVVPLVTGLEVGTYAPYDIGPLSLLPLPSGGWAVGEGGGPPGQERVSFYGPDGMPSFEPLVPAGGGNFYGLAIQPATGNLLIASASTDRLFGAQPAPTGGFSEPVAIVPDTTEEPIAAAAPTALAFDPDGRLYVGFAGEGSSRIVRIDTETSFVETVAQATSPVTGIAFRSSDSTVFFTVFGATDRASGAVFHIDTNGVAAEFAGGLAGPTALAFDDADALYVTTIGTPPNAASGQLLKITVVAVEEPATEEEPAVSNREGGIPKRSGAQACLQEDRLESRSYRHVRKEYGPKGVPSAREKEKLRCS